MIAVPATPADHDRGDQRPDPADRDHDEEAAEPVERAEQREDPGRLQPGRAEVEGEGGDQEREPGELQHEEELPDQLLAVGVGRPHRRDQRLGGEDHHHPHLLEGVLDGQQPAAQRFARHRLIALPEGAAARCARRRTSCSLSRCASASCAISVSRVCSSSSTPATWATARRGAVGRSGLEVARCSSQARPRAGRSAAAAPAAPRSLRSPPSGRPGAGHRHDRQVARAEAGLARPGAAHRWRSPPAAAPPRRPSATKVPWPWRVTTRPVRLERLVDRPHGADVDPGPLGEPAEARQPLAGRQLAGADQRPQAPAELQPDRQLVAGIDRERVRLPSCAIRVTQ